jgi:hypothetical protein
MSRRIITQNAAPVTSGTDALNATEEVRQPDKYTDKLLKDIPADVIAAWLAAKGLILSAGGVPTNLILWISFAIGLVLTFLWTLKQTSEPGKKPAITQCAISSAAFVIWAMAMGSPFDFNTLYSSLLLILFSLVVPLINPREG